MNAMLTTPRITHTLVMSRVYFDTTFVEAEVSRLVCVKPVVAYSIIRIVLFAALVAILVPLLSTWLPAWGSTLIAAVIAFCISYLAFGTLRGRVAADLAASRASKQQSTIKPAVRSSDEEAEDGPDLVDPPVAPSALESDRGSESKAV
jgi:hypothetical protein